MTKSEEDESKDWKKTGYLGPEDLELPSEDRMREKPVAVVECPQEIPCDPCKVHCPVDAVKMEDLNDTPRVDFDQCTGCSICVQKCPGLAVFMVQIINDEAKITLPYEFELPDEEEIVDALNRKGEKVCEGEVVNIISKEETVGDTALVTLKIPRNYIENVRGFERVNNER